VNNNINIYLMIEKNKKLEDSIRTNKIILERLEKKLNDLGQAAAKSGYLGQTAAFSGYSGGCNSGGAMPDSGEAVEGGTNTAIKGQIECIKKKIQKKELKIEKLKKGEGLLAEAVTAERLASKRCMGVKPVSGKVEGKKGVGNYDLHYSTTERPASATRVPGWPILGVKSNVVPEEINKTVRNRNFKQNYYKNNNIIEKTKRYIDSFYDEYLKIEETVPEYMIKNLEKMPNNKGYIWRGIRLYGKLAVTNSLNSKTVYLDERKHGEMFIHEITPVVENLYKKNGNGYGKHQLVSNTVRKIKKHTPLHGVQIG